MAITQWDERFFTSTRGRILALVRQGAGTVDELARALGLTDNAVRAHLNTLERDRLVCQSGVERGHAGKPAHIYMPTEEAERLFPKPYGTVLGLLLEVLTERMPSSELEAALIEVGHRLAHGILPADGASSIRLSTAVEALNTMGGLAELDEQNSHVVIRGRSCPLAGVIRDHPQVCKVASTLVSDISGVAFEADCDHGEQPRCQLRRVWL